MSDERMPGTEHIDDAELSAYLDGEVESEARRRAIAAHLEECPACRQALRELALLVTELAALPLHEPPRSFRLTEAMVPPRLLPTPWFVRFQPAMRWAAAAAAVLLVLVVGADLVIHTGVSGPTATESAARPPSVTTAGASTTSALSTTQPAQPAAGAAVHPAPASPVAAAAVAGSAAASPAATAVSRTTTTSAASSATPVAAPAPTTATAFGTSGAAPPSGTPRGPAALSGWRLAELGLTLALLWLLVAVVALPRLRRPRS